MDLSTRRATVALKVRNMLGLEQVKGPGWYWYILGLKQWSSMVLQELCAGTEEDVIEGGRLRTGIEWMPEVGMSVVVLPVSSSPQDASFRFLCWWQWNGMILILIGVIDLGLVGVLVLMTDVGPSEAKGRGQLVMDSLIYRRPCSYGRPWSQASGESSLSKLGLQPRQEQLRELWQKEQFSMLCSSSSQTI